MIGADFDPTFVTWLFNELSTHYPPPPTASVPISSSTSTNSISDSRQDSRYNNPRRNGPSMFNAAMSGMKRDNRGFDEGNGGQNQRARYERPEGFDGIPAGPRSNVAANGQVNGRNDMALSRNGGGRSLADRVGPHVRNNGYGFDAVRSFSLILFEQH